MVSRNTTLVPSMGLRIGLAYEVGLSVGMRRDRVPPQRIKLKDKDSEDSYSRSHRCLFVVCIFFVILFLLPFVVNKYVQDVQNYRDLEIWV